MASAFSNFLGDHAPENIDALSWLFMFWVALLLNPGAFYPPKPVVSPVLGDFAPEQMYSFLTFNLSVNAPVHPERAVIPNF